MNKELLAYLREFFKDERARKEYILYEELPGNECLDEIERLAARDEWLTTLLGRALVYVDEANMPASWELGDAIRLAISKRESL